jgi:hypothetical protein
MWYRGGPGEHQTLAGVGVSDAGGLAHAANVLLTDRISVVSMATAPGHSIDTSGALHRQGRYGRMVDISPTS